MMKRDLGELWKKDERRKKRNPAGEAEPNPSDIARESIAK